MSPADYATLAARAEGAQLARTKQQLREARDAPAPTQIPILERASDIAPAAVRWLWPGRIPFGKLTVLSGDPDLGKSTILLDLAARVSTGRAMPDGAHTDPGSVVILSAEDGAGDTIIPRLVAAGAARGRIYLLNAVRSDNTTTELVLPDHLEALAIAVRQTDAVLVIVDPFSAYLTGAVNSFKDHDLRRALRPLAAYAAETGVALVATRHLNKSGAGKALYRGGGSIALTGAARSELLAAPDQDDATRRVLAVVKCNLAPKAESLMYRLVAAPNNTARVEWLGVSALTADQLVSVADNAEARTELDEGRAFLREELAEGAKPANAVRTAARQAGIADRTLDRAKRAERVRSFRVGRLGAGGHWMMELPVPSTNGGPEADYASVERDALRDGGG